MSNEALAWAFEEAPIPPLPSGKPDPTAAAVLSSLAYHANKDGRGSWPSIQRVQLETRLSRTAVREGLARLVDAGLIEKSGTSTAGTTVWRLNVDKKRSVSFMEELAGMVVEGRARTRGYVREHRAKKHPVRPPNDLTGLDVRPSGGLCKAAKRPYVRPPNDPEQEGEQERTVTGAAPAPDPSRPTPPQAPGSNESGQPTLDGPPPNSSPELDPLRAAAGGAVIPFRRRTP